MKKKYNKEKDKKRISYYRFFYVFIVGFCLFFCGFSGMIGFKWIISNLYLPGENQEIESLIVTLKHLYVLVTVLSSIAVSVIMLPFVRLKGLNIKKQRSKRLLFSPLISAIFQLLAWIAPLFYLIYYMIINGNYDSSVFGILFSLILVSSGVFSFSFIICEYLVTRVFVSGVFVNNDVCNYSSALLPGIVFKSYMLFVTMAVIPSAVLMQQIYYHFLENNNLKAFNSIKYYYIIFILMTSVLYTLIIKHHKRLIISMTEVIKKIARGDYTGRTAFTTTDEAGELAEIINNTAISLKEKELIKDTFGDMVDPVVRDFLLKGSLNLDGDKVFATMVIVDICNYSETVSELKTKDQIKYLNTFFDRMSGLIESTGGLVNKFVADSIFAVFGAPVSNGKHSNIALECADNMRDYLVTLNRELSEKKLPLIDYSIGLHTGEVIAGNVGSNSRKQYTVTGKPVNTAFGISQLAQIYHVPVLLSNSTYYDLDSKDDLNLRYVDCVKLRSEDEPVTVYEYFESDKEKNKKHKKRYLDKYNTGVEYYREGKFSDALDCFLYCHEEMPWDYISAMYIKRCNKLIKNPPAKWNCVALINR